jgi:hypothetical protein
LTLAIEIAYHKAALETTREGRNRMRNLGIILLGVFFLLIDSSAWGDSTIESTVKTGGIKGMGASEGTLIKRYQKDKKWESVSTKFTGAILSRVVGGSEGTNIARLDKGVYWNLDPKNHTYVERPIEVSRKEDLSKERGEKEKPKARVTKSEFTVKKTGASETINGFACEEYLVTWLLEMEDLETKAKSRSTMTTNLWATPETATIRKVQAEEQEFQKAYARKLGLTISPDEAKQLGMEALGSVSGARPEEIQKGLIRVKEEMSKIKGYPIRTVVSWILEGERAASAGTGEKASSGSIPDIPKNIGGILGGLAGRVTQKMAGEKPSPTGGKEGPFFSSITEVKAINGDPISAEIFEIPAGYVKK